MTKITTAALFFLAAGIFTSVSVLSAYQVLFAIPLAYYTFIAIKEKNFKLPTSAWFLLAFAAVAILSLVVNLDVVPKPSKNFGRVKYFLFGALGIFAFRVWLNEASDKAKKILSYTFLASIVATACYAIWFKFTYPELRVTGLTNTMRYGYGSGMALLVILSAILHQEKIKSWFNWKVAAPIFVLGFIGLYLTMTRGALLGFLCGLPFVLYFYRAKLGFLFGGVSVLILAVVGGFYLFGTFDHDDGRGSPRILFNKNNKSDTMRRSQWQAAVIATKEKPLLGWGLSNFHSQLKRIKIENNLDHPEYNDAHSHNLFLEVASGTGLVGLILFLGWVISWAVESFKQMGLVRAFVVPFGVAFVISSQFEVTFDANNAVMIFFLYALSSARKSYV